MIVGIIYIIFGYLLYVIFDSVNYVGGLDIYICDPVLSHLAKGLAYGGDSSIVFFLILAMIILLVQAR